MLLRWKKWVEDDTRVSVLLQLSLRSLGDILSFESHLSVYSESWCVTLRLLSLWRNIKAFRTAADVRECKDVFPSLVLLHGIRCVAFLKGNTLIKSQCVAALCSRIYLLCHRSVLLQTSCPVQTAVFHLQAWTDAGTNIKMFTCEGRKWAIKGSHGLLMSYETQELHDPFRVSQQWDLY